MTSTESRLASVEGSWDTVALDLRNGWKFEVPVWIAGQGQPLLYLHGFERHPGNGSFLGHLAKDHRVFAPEHPGYGYSGGAEQLNDIHDVVFFYRSLVEALGVSAADVVGHSLGGMVAAELAAANPQFVRRLVLIDAFGLWADDAIGVDPFGAASQVRRALWHDPENAGKPQTSSFRPDPDDPLAKPLYDSRNLAAATRLLWPVPDRGLRRRLAFVTAPTLVVNGRSDGLVPLAHAEEMAKLVVDARLVVIDEAGHYPMIEQESEFLAAVEQFLAQ
jgi:pimeloyl-ACP methyl ester carboxylesterase